MANDLCAAVLTVVAWVHVVTRSRKLEASPQASQLPDPQWGCASPSSSSAQAEHSQVPFGIFSSRSGQPMQSMSPQRRSMIGQYEARMSSSVVRGAMESSEGCGESPPTSAFSRDRRALSGGFLCLLFIHVLDFILEYIRGSSDRSGNRCGPESPNQHQMPLRTKPPQSSGHSGSMGVGSSFGVVVVYMGSPTSALLADCYTYGLKLRSI